MTADLSDGTCQVVGVLQLMEKRRRGDDVRTMLELNAGGTSEKSKHSGPCDEFTPEDVDFFGILLKVLGLAALRTMQAASMVEVVPGGGRTGSRDKPIALSVERLLNGRAV
mmetsp:Transcript_18147/g.47942  ORF Transcript_18147/g.47942 Transcript_18147/m.47942 type:complete len:111 (-) Transcript_18147:43-375(-)